MTSSSVLLCFIHDRTTKPRVIATRLAHSSLQMTMIRSCDRSTSEIRWLRNERLARIEPARRRNRLIPCPCRLQPEQPAIPPDQRSSRAQLWRDRKDFDGGDRGNNQMAQSMSAKGPSNAALAAS